MKIHYLSGFHVRILLDLYLDQPHDIYWRRARTCCGEEGRGRCWVLFKHRLTLRQLRPLMTSGLIAYTDQELRNRLALTTAGREAAQALLNDLVDKIDPVSRWFMK